MQKILKKFGIQDLNPGACSGPKAWLDCKGEVLEVYSPIDGSRLAAVRQTDPDAYDRVLARSTEAFRAWRTVPAPRRGEVIRQLGQRLRDNKDSLGRMVTVETGKILAEGLGEVQEMIDICDFAVGLSRQLYGLSLHSERPEHRMYEQYHPLGPVGLVTAFNFPVAVWAWNAAIAAVCGDPVVWKPSSKTPLTAIAVQTICNQVARDNPDIVPEGLFSLVIGSGRTVGDRLINDPRLPLISATGSCRMGREIAAACARRLGRSLLELGGNNAVIVMEDADLELALRAVLFGAVGTAGQRCTSTRRLILQKGIAAEMTARLVRAYGKIKIGNPLNPGVLLGPVIDRPAQETFLKAVEEAKRLGGKIIYGGKAVSPDGLAGGFYVEPTLVRARNDWPLVREETFAPILYLLEVADIREAIAVNNDVPQGLSSSIFTGSLRHSEAFLAATGSDCGIANVNIGTSGAEIGGAFGGEKETGGGRESGSDAWKAYMRRQTNTLNWGSALPLAQGIEFGIDR